MNTRTVVKGREGNSIILIGMPGAGKSTIGPLLAEKLGLAFRDTDQIIKEHDGRALRDIVAQDGFETFLAIQHEIIESQEFRNCVIATGGSVVMSSALMQYFKALGKIIYLNWDICILEERLAPDRRLARTNGQSFRQLFEEREPQYRVNADYIIDCSNKSPYVITDEIAQLYL